MPTIDFLAPYPQAIHHKIQEPWLQTFNFNEIGSFMSTNF